MKSFVRPVHSWILLGCLAMLMLVLAACGGDSGSAASSSSNTSASGSSSNTSASSAKSVMTVMIKETKGATSNKDVYTFSPATITIKKGDTITIENDSDELQDIDKGDAQKAGVDKAIPVNQSGTMTFNTAGTFTLQSEKGATITVTVQ
jgi:plastocyanin